MYNKIILFKIFFGLKKDQTIIHAAFINIQNGIYVVSEKYNKNAGKNMNIKGRYVINFKLSIIWFSPF